MSQSGQEPAYYRSKAAHMHKLAEQAQHGVARVTYLLLEASWLRLAKSAEKKNERESKGN